MSTGPLGPLTHDPARLRIAAALAALPDGDALSVTRLQNMLGLPWQPDHPPARAGPRRVRADGKDLRRQLHRLGASPGVGCALLGRGGFRC
ncbi:MAG TPA: hypothetical protein VFQ68_07645 [Streptosporangiaceae bacterium]|nr:hypothetical protein [Streptosporangiaceae bacterium]